MAGILGLVQGLVSPIAGIFQARQKRKADHKAAQDTVDRILAEASAKDASVAGEIALVKVKNENSTWKDEYALLVISMPVVLLMCAGVASAFGLPVDVPSLAEALFSPLTLLPDWWSNTFQMAMLSALGVTLWNKAKP